MKSIFTSIALFFCVLGVSGQAKYTLDSTELTSRIIKDSLDIPWEIVWGPDNHIWCTERFGRVSRINPTSGNQTVLLDISSDVYERSEAGMLGMVLHPDFANEPHVFIAYTYLSGSKIRERLVRYNYDGTKLIAADTLIENIVGNTTHIGCRLIILKDNTLLMSTGDAQNQTLPQNSTSLSGKILRLNLDGTIPADNPDPSSYVWSKGHRNAQGLWLAPNGNIYSSEHGPTTDDELNILTKNSNYGWPTVAGFCDSPPENAFCTDSNVVEPLAAWTPTIAPSDIIWYDNLAIPEFKDKLLMTVLKDKSLVVFGFNSAGDSVISVKKYFKNDFGRLRDVCVSPLGRIYLATNGNSWSNTNPYTHSIIELSNEAFLNIKEEDILKNIKLSPNPIEQNEPIILELPNGEEGELLIFDVYGRIILKEEIKTTSNINLDSPMGIYFWKVILRNGKNKSGRIIIK